MFANDQKSGVYEGKVMKVAYDTKKFPEQWSRVTLPRTVVECTLQYCARFDINAHSLQ